MVSEATPVRHYDDVDVIRPTECAFSLGWIVDEEEGNSGAYHEPSVVLTFLSVSLEN